MTRPRTLLVTGTDTGVGKTHVACGVVRTLVAEGSRVAVRKPVETGCETRGGERHPQDGAALREAAGSVEPLARVCPYRFAAPLAPAAAASLEGERLDPARVVAACREGSDDFDWLVVEGAGGLLVPIAGAWSFADLASELGAAVLVVVGARLGAINHTLLTLEVARRRGLSVAGWIVNHAFGRPPPNGDPAASGLRTSLEALVAEPCLGEVAFGEPARIHIPRA